MPIRIDDQRSATVALGLLSWRAPATLEQTLRSYASEDLFELFDERLIFFQQISDADRSVAARFDIPCIGSEINLGIYGGVQALLESLTADYVLLLENDCPLIEPADEVRRQLHVAVADLVAGRADLYRMRHRRRPGSSFSRAEKYQRFYLPEAATADGATVSPAARLAVRLRRWLRPLKARRLLGSAVYVDEHPERQHPHIFERTEQGNYIVSSQYLNWTNQSILVPRQWMLDTILSYVAANPCRRTVNGFSDIEKELNSRWWRAQGFRIGIGRGLFTHDRLDR